MIAEIINHKKLLENDFVIHIFHFFLFIENMSGIQSKMDASKMLDELMKATSSCYSCFCKSEELSSVDVNEVKAELLKASEKVDMNGSKTYLGRFSLGQWCRHQ